jgi:hypothetical protein
MPFLVDGRFFTSFEGEEVPDVEVWSELAVRVGSRLDAFSKPSTDGSTTRLEPPWGGLWDAITAAGVVQQLCAHSVRLTDHKLGSIDKP